MPLILLLLSSSLAYDGRASSEYAPLAADWCIGRKPSQRWITQGATNGDKEGVGERERNGKADDNLRRRGKDFLGERFHGQGSSVLG